MGGLRRSIVRPGGPTTEIRPHFADPTLTESVQTEPEGRHTAVFLVEGQPRKPHPVADDLFHLIQGDLPLGPVHHVVGNARFPAPLAVVRPILRQEQVAGHHAGERIVRVVVGVQQVLPDHAVLLLAPLATPLPFHPRRLLALLRMGRSVDHTDRVFRAVSVHDLLAQHCVHPSVVPHEERKELLQRPHGHARGQCDRLDAFALQVRDEPDDVPLPVIERRGTLETRPEDRQQRSQSRLQGSNLIRSHREVS
jgi:hypothetical protein